MITGSTYASNVIPQVRYGGNSEACKTKSGTLQELTGEGGNGMVTDVLAEREADERTLPARNRSRGVVTRFRFEFE